MINRKAESSPTFEHSQRIAVSRANWDQELKSIGRRYIGKRLESFLIIDPSDYPEAEREAVRLHAEQQSNAIEALKRFCKDIECRVEQGDGLVLFGPKGTGKDMLAVACLRVAAEKGFIVKFEDGHELFQRFRDVIGDESSEKTAVERYTKPDVLLLSDPIPVAGSTTDYQRSVLWRIVDRRYRDMKPTWVTLNVESSQEAEQKLGGQIVDRLRDGALAVVCKWPSYRRSSKGV